MSEQKFTVGSSITESYRFLADHMPHFFRLIYGPLILWVLVMVTKQILLVEHDIHINSVYFLNVITAAFAIVWYRQFLLGSDYASYRLLIKKGFSNSPLSFKRVSRALLRILVVSLVLLVPTLILSFSMMVYFHGQGVPLSEAFIQELAFKSTLIIMLVFSPILIRLSLYAAGFALGRASLRIQDVWKRTRGYTVTLWWVTLRAFLPLSIYSYILTWFLDIMSEKLSINYIVSTIIIESLAGFLTFMILAIVVAANAEAFRILIGVREGDVPHRDDLKKNEAMHPGTNRRQGSKDIPQKAGS